MKRITNFFRSIKYGIENLIRWAPTIWKDRDWDHWYLYKMLQFKLIQMEKLHRKYGHAVSSEDKANEMKVCIKLLERLINDEYGENVFKHHHKKWGEPHFDWEDCKDREGYSELHITHKHVNSEEDKKQERKEFSRLSKHEELLKRQDIEYLFKMMTKQIQGWWD